MPATPRPHADVVSQELEGETVLVDLRTNEIYVLNETGARLWSLLAEGCSRDEIRTRLVAEYAVEVSVLDAELDAMFDGLVEAGLVVP